MRAYRNEHADTYRKQEKTAWIAFLSEFPNLVISVVTAFFAGTLVCWTDCASSLESTTHCLLVALMSGRMKKETGDRYNYGMDRLEIFISFICDSLAVIGMLIIMVSSVYGLFFPQQPEESLLWFLILKGINMAFDLYFLFNQKKINRMHSSKLNESELKKSRYNLISDAAVGVAVLVCFVFRTQVWVAYLSPAFSIVMAAVFAAGYIRHISRSVTELLDAALPITEQDKLYDIVLQNRQMIRKIESVSSHRLNERVYVDICLSLLEQTTFAEQKELLAQLNRDIQQIMPGAEVRLLVQAPSAPVHATAQDGAASC